jgi:hypothetical protein
MFRQEWLEELVERYTTHDPHCDNAHAEPSSPTQETVTRREGRGVRPGPTTTSELTSKEAILEASPDPGEKHYESEG